MARNAIIAFSFLCFFFCVSTVSASVLINEVKYSPTSKQWIEIYNNTDTDIDITAYRVLDSGAPVNGHGISAYNNGVNIISSHGYAIIAKYPDEFTNVSFPVFKSSLNIKVSSDNVILRNQQGEDVSNVNIDGTAIEGNSFQIISGAWKVAIPTPGVSNESTILKEEENSTPNSNIGIPTNSNFIIQKTEIPKIKTKIVADSVVFVGIPIEIRAVNTGYSGDELNYGKNYWNFGDGSYKEQVNKFEKIFHTYYYPGKYVLYLEYSSNPYLDVVDASSKALIEVIPIDVVISKIGNENDFFVEITNNSEHEVDISGWKLFSVEKDYVFPKNTIIQNDGSIILSPKLTGFVYEKQNEIKLLDTNQNIISEYKKRENDTKIGIPLAKNIVNKEVNRDYSVNINNIEKTLNSEKSVAEKNNNSFIFFLIFVILLLASSGAVYFVRKRKANYISDEFQILDE